MIYLVLLFDWTFVVLVLDLAEVGGEVGVSTGTRRGLQQWNGKSHHGHSWSWRHKNHHDSKKDDKKKKEHKKDKKKDDKKKKEHKKDKKKKDHKKDDKKKKDHKHHGWKAHHGWTP